MAVPAGAKPAAPITLVGHHLVSDLPGVDIFCRFGEPHTGAAVAGMPFPEARVVGNQWRSHTVRCVTPSQGIGALSRVPLSISLNGGFDYADPINFTIL